MNSTSSPGRKSKRSRSALGIVTCPFVLTRLTAMVCAPLCVSPHLRQRHLGLGQPEGHVHVTIEGDGSGQGSAGQLALAGRSVQRAEATVAVGLERAHAQLFGEGEGLAVVLSGLIALRRLAPRRNLAKEAQGIGLVAAFLVLMGARQRALSKGKRVLRMTGQQMCLPQGQTTEHLID